MKEVEGVGEGLPFKATLRDPKFEQQPDFLFCVPFPSQM